MKLMRIYSDKYAAALEANGQGEYVDTQATTPAAPAKSGDGVMLPLTGHTLPHPNATELLASETGGGVANYVVRVMHEAGVPADRDGGVNVFAIQMGGMLAPEYALFGKPKPDGENWALIADAFWDRQIRKQDSVYLTPEERQRAQQGAAGNWGGNAPQPPTTGGETQVPIDNEP